MRNVVGGGGRALVQELCAEPELDAVLDLHGVFVPSDVVYNFRRRYCDVVLLGQPLRVEPALPCPVLDDDPQHGSRLPQVASMHRARCPFSFPRSLGGHQVNQMTNYSKCKARRDGIREANDERRKVLRAR